MSLEEIEHPSDEELILANQISDAVAAAIEGGELWEAEAIGAVIIVGCDYARGASDPWTLDEVIEMVRRRWTQPLPKNLNDYSNSEGALQ